jgi:hypothetical protein
LKPIKRYFFYPETGQTYWDESQYLNIRLERYIEIKEYFQKNTPRAVYPLFLSDE